MPRKKLAWPRTVAQLAEQAADEWAARERVQLIENPKVLPGANIRIVLPLKTVSESNRAGHEHWAVRARRANIQRTAVHAAVVTMMSKTPGWTLGVRNGKYGARDIPPAARIRVDILRCAPGTLDENNLTGSQKHVIDGIADALGIDDRSSRVEYVVSQKKAPKGHYSIEISIVMLQERPCISDDSDSPSATPPT